MICLDRTSGCGTTEYVQNQFTAVKSRSCVLVAWMSDSLVFSCVLLNHAWGNSSSLPLDPTIRWYCFTIRKQLVLIIVSCKYYYYHAHINELYRVGVVWAELGTPSKPSFLYIYYYDKSVQCSQLLELSNIMIIVVYYVMPILRDRAVQQES